jgi:hypothetical protein
MERNTLIRIFQILAVVLAGAAVFLWWQENTDWAFASGVCAASSYFLSLRFQMKERVLAADAEKERAAAALNRDQDPNDEEDKD